MEWKRGIRVGLVSSVLMAWASFASAQTEGCRAAFTLGPDVILCYPQTAVEISAQTEWTILTLDWIVPPGVSFPNATTAAVNTTGIVTLVATASLRSPNRLVNGDFSDGNTGFSSQLIHSPITLLPPNTYAITTNPASIHPDFKPCPDHTSGTGRMLASNGNITPNRNVWCQTVAVDPGGEYELSFWASALTENELAQLVFRIDGVELGQPLVPGPETCEWINRTITWAAGMQTSAEVCIRNLTGANSGNDFALDDISMVQYCTVSDTMVVRHQPRQESRLDTLICQGQSVSVGGQTFNGTTLTTLTLPGMQGCDSLIQLDLLVVSPGLSVDPPSVLSCRDSVLALRASTAFGGPGQSFQWRDAFGQDLPAGGNAEVTVSAPGLYTVVWTLQTPIGGCTASAIVEVLADTIRPVAFAGPDRALTCDEPDVLLQAGPGGSYSYRWINLDGQDPQPADQPSATLSAPGRIVLEVLDTGNGCSARDTLLLTDSRQEPGDIALAVADPFCLEASGRIEVLSIGLGASPFTYRLLNGQGNAPAGGPVFTGLLPGDYFLRVTDGNGCTAERSLTIGAVNIPLVTLPSGLGGKAGETLLVSPLLTFPPDLVTAYRWTATGLTLDCPECPQTGVAGLGRGLLRLCLQIGADCERCAETELVFEEGDLLYLPNAFSPNGDGVNDAFGPFPAGQVIRSFPSMRVFDRWGGLVYEWTDQTQGALPRWNGMARGMPAATGSYIYVLEAILTDGSLRQWSGEVFLVK
jgi:gliding motility-associated-like protein